jgi:hypothetical protein
LMGWLHSVIETTGIASIGSKSGATYHRKNIPIGIGC